MVGFAKELMIYMKERKKLWMLPLLVLMAALGFIVFFSQGSVVTPFIYTIF